MTEALADSLGRATPELCRLYERWSAGGAGLLITGNIQVDRRYLERPGNPAIDGPQSEDQMARLRAYAEASMVGGNQTWVQLGHPGRQCSPLVNTSPVGPSDIGLGGAAGAVRPLTDAEIVETELLLADLEAMERRFDTTEKRAKGGDKNARAQLALLTSVMAALQDGRPARTAEISDDQQAEFRQLQLLTTKMAWYYLFHWRFK